MTTLSSFSDYGSFNPETSFSLPPTKDGEGIANNSEKASSSDSEGERLPLNKQAIKRDNAGPGRHFFTRDLVNVTDNNIQDPDLQPAHQPRTVTDNKISSMSFFCKKQHLPHLIGIIGLIATSAIAKWQFSGDQNSRILSACLFINGASVSPSFDFFVFRLCFYSENLKEFRTATKKSMFQMISGYSYPLVFIATQIVLNLFPDKKTKDLVFTAFTWFLGLHIGKDIMYHLSEPFDRLPLPPRCAISPSDEWLFCSEDKQDLSMLAFRTRDLSSMRKTVFVVSVIALVVFEIFYWIFKKEINSIVGLAEIDVVGDLLAFFSGITIGEFITFLIDNKAEGLEETWHNAYNAERDERNKPPMPLPLKLLKGLDRTFSVASSPLIGALLALPLDPNGIGNHINMAITGTLYGSREFISRRRFENWTPKIKMVSAADPAASTAEKVFKYTIKYVFPLIGLTALTIYLLWVGFNSPNITNRTWLKISAILVSALVGAALTEFLHHIFEHGKNTRCINELSFRMLHSVINLTIAYQYMSTVANVYKENLEKDSTSLFMLELAAFICWGLAMGNNFSILAHQKWQDPTTHPLTTQELANRAISAFY